jgi:CHAD domain-containing protein
MRATRGPRPAAATPTVAANIQAPLARVVERRVRALDDDLLDALKGDVGAVHKARVATRRLREAVPLTLARGKGRRLSRRLRKLTRALGPLRELDVAIAGLADRAGRRRTPGYAALRRHLASERKAAFARLRDAIDRPRAGRLLARVEKQVRRIDDGDDGARLATRARRLLIDRTVERARTLRDAVAESGAIFIVERVHAVRIEAKRLRYALELAGELHIAPTGPLVTRLKAVQDLLGELHDLDVLRAHATVIRATGGAPAHDLDTLTVALEEDARHLHARYLRRTRALVLLTDHVRDRMASCLDPSTSTSSGTPSPSHEATPGPTTPSAPSPTRASGNGAARRQGSAPSTPGPT